tara:strand:+ start:625 stop:1620 length:996 start_codon:yes stop_codon:yes gene_type:complete
MLKVSVIIPVYNITEYLIEALDSVFSQTMARKEFEVIVVDDGSKEPVNKQLLKYQHYDSIKLISQKNKGLPAARNAGIKEALGDFLVFLDADDTLNREKLERQSRILSKNPEASFVYSNACLIKNNQVTSEVVGRGLRTRKGSSCFDIYFDCAISIHAAMCRRSQAINIDMFDERLLHNEDDDFWFRLSVEFGDGIYDSYVSCNRRLHDSQMTKNEWKTLYYMWRTMEKNSILYRDQLINVWPRVVESKKAMKANYLYVKNSKNSISNEHKKYLKRYFRLINESIVEDFFSYKVMTFIELFIFYRKRLLLRILLKNTGLYNFSRKLRGKNV